MKTLHILLFLTAVCSSITLAQDYSTRTMTIRLNGHDYVVPDLISKELNAHYLAERSSIETKIKQDMDNKDGVSRVDAFVPSVISSIKFSSGTSGKGKLEIYLNDIILNFTVGGDLGCRYDTDFDVKLTADVEAVPDALQYNLVISNISATGGGFHINKSETESPWLWWLDIVCGYVGVGVDIYGTVFLNNLKEKFAGVKQEIFQYDKMSDIGLTSSQIQEAINSFPLQFSITGGTNQDLVISLNFLRGTLANPSAFDGVTPATVSDKTFEHIGFNLSSGSLYNAFITYNPSKRPFTTAEEYGNLDQRNFIIQSMKNYLGRTVSFYFHWSDIAQDASGTTLLVNGSFDPATLTPGPGGPLEAKIAELYANGQWQKSTDILTSLHNNEFDVVATVGTGGILKDGAISKPMAPDRTLRGINGDYFYVDKNTYLYYLKIFAHAVVRKYKDQIGRASCRERV
jgi:hypothetical protein